ncbi:TPA: phage tail protein [Escherichia coli]|uniref:prophage tail fiber N-terminal domain-containing protein n=1 Tax=Escherichia coli TaxID=562 RepID=UPI0002243769|nr:prophage tail fiber N-terminal domain-containing protein [Escherichia coli]EES3796551.1 phage tail protein [Escherichia coli]EFG2176998.1 phage tail protein [Escherichia coli]EFJ5712509.1 phage tail protein [Escherichia coli]EFK1930344.1 phage tail protein [Escherichia coli]EFL5791184.1 phage tail protein [Escherichia coli]
MAKISGVYANGLGEPVPGINLVLTARATSSGVIMTTTAAQQTGAGGEYCFELQPGVYVVTASGAYLGVITVNPDSVDGTLNAYLTNFSADEMTPAALAEVQELVATAQAAASVASGAATEARQNAAAAAAAAQISTAAAGSARFENFDEIININTTAMLELEKPEVLDPDITITITETINYDYVGPVNGFCDVASPLEYKIQMYAYTTGEYFNGETNLTADGKFYFKRSWAGAKQFRLVRIADSKWITTLEYPLCIRSYWMPDDADPAVVKTMKDRCYTYDQAVAAMALMVQQHDAVERYVAGLCALVEDAGGVKFYVNRLSAQSHRAYYRMGNVAWVLYALAFYLHKFPTGDQVATVREKIAAGCTWVDTFRVITPGDPREGLYMGGSGKFYDGGTVFDPDYIATWCALEHNVDIYFLFELLGRISGFESYKSKAADLAADIIEKFWIESEGRFRQGVHEDAPDNVAALDQSSWGGIFAAHVDPDKAVRCRKYMERFRYGTQECAGYTPYDLDQGYSTQKRGVWCEGVGGVALFERLLGNEERAIELIAGMTPLRNKYGYRDSCMDPTYDTLPNWPSTTNTGWMILCCQPSGFWNVNAPKLSIGIVRY